MAGLADGLGDGGGCGFPFHPLGGKAVAAGRLVEAVARALRLLLEIAGQPVEDLGHDIRADGRIDGRRRDHVEAEDMRLVVAGQRAGDGQQRVQPLDFVQGDEKRPVGHGETSSDAGARPYSVLRAVMGSSIAALRAGT